MCCLAACQESRTKLRGSGTAEAFHAYLAWRQADDRVRSCKCCLDHVGQEDLLMANEGWVADVCILLFHHNFHTTDSTRFSGPVFQLDRTIGAVSDCSQMSCGQVCHNMRLLKSGSRCLQLLWWLTVLLATWCRLGVACAASAADAGVADGAAVSPRSRPGTGADVQRGQRPVPGAACPHGHQHRQARQHPGQDFGLRYTSWRGSMNMHGHM